MLPEDTPDEDPRAEIAALKRRVAALEEALQASERAREGSRDAQQILHIVMDHIPLSIFWKGRDLTYLGCNKRFAEDANLASPADIIGKTDMDLVSGAQAELYRADDQAVMDSGVAKLNSEEPQQQADGRTIWVRTTKIPVRDERGQVVAVLGMAEDITAAKEAEAEQLRLHQEVILAQKRTLRALSVPLIPISDRVVALILIGSIDRERGARIMETLVHGIATHQAAVAIVDITGVKDMSAKVAGGLVNSARAAELLGAKVILTGIAPEIARSLVQMGADLGPIESQRNLQAGIESALKQSHRRTELR